MLEQLNETLIKILNRQEIGPPSRNPTSKHHIKLNCEEEQLENILLKLIDLRIREYEN